MKKNKIKIIFLTLFVSTFIISCGKGKKDEQRTQVSETEIASIDTSGAITGDWLIIREMADAEKLNPIVSNDATADEITNYMFETLTDLDPITYELIPGVAELPEISDDHLTYTYKLKKNVTFSDGKPLTGEDVVFTAKAIKNPFVDAAALRNYYESVKKVELVNGDPYVVKFTMSKPYWRAIYSNGSFKICPKHIIDPEGLTDKYSWDELSDFKVAAKNPDINKFAEFLNSQEVSRDPKYVVGSGQFMLELWNTGQEIRLKRNPNYWNKSRPSYAEKLIFKTIQDNSSALVSAKNKEIDAMYIIKPADFYNELKNPEQYDLIKTKPSEPAYTYLGWNNKDPFFKDKKVRMALSHLIDRKIIIEKIMFGDGIPIQSHVYYKDKKHLNADLLEIPYDPEKAKQLLKEAGWEDTDKDGVLDKVIDNKKMDFKFTFLINTNPVRKQILLVVVDALKKVGIIADVQELEWSVFLDKIKKHEFAATYGAWALPVTPTDPYQIWHSSQSKGEGSNHISFINEESDKMLEEYRDSFDEAKRIEIIRKWQKLIYDEQPYTFLWSPKARYIYNNRFKNARWYSKQPSPTYSEWWVPKGSQKYTQKMQ